jgi:hypothetical protein
MRWGNVRPELAHLLSSKASRSDFLAFGQLVANELRCGGLAQLLKKPRCPLFGGIVGGHQHRGTVAADGQVRRYACEDRELMLADILFSFFAPVSERHTLPPAVRSGILPCAVGAGRGCGDGASAGCCPIVGSAFEPPTVVAGLNDIAVVGQTIEQRGRHLGVAERTIS